MRRFMCVIALLWTCSLFSATKASSKKPAPKDNRDPRDKLSVLVESYNLSKELVPEDRAVLLNLICYTAGQHRVPYTVSWAEENYLLARQLPMDWNRVAIEKNAVVAISYLQPKRAMSLLKVMDLPVADPDGSIAEDVRSDGAALVFKNFYAQQKTSALPSIRQTAVFLGTTGQYPYPAVEGIILDLAPKTTLRENLPVEVTSLISDAFASYRRSSNYRTEDREFAHFLKALHPILPAALFREGLTIAVERLSTEKSIPLGNNLAYISHVNTVNGEATFDRPEDAILFDLLPLVREVDPAWATRIIEQNQALQQGGGNTGKTIDSRAGVYTTKPEDQGFVSDYVKLQSVNVMVEENNPEEAWKVSQSISNSALKASAMAAVGSAFATSSPDRTKGIEDTISNAIAETKDANDRLVSLSALTRTAAAAKDQIRFLDALHRSFVLGEELFQEELETHPLKPVMSITSYDALKGVVLGGFGFDPRSTLGAIDQVRNTSLKAYLLLDYADAAYAKQQ